MTDVARTRFQALVEQWRIQSDGTLDLERGRLLNRCADDLSALLVQEEGRTEWTPAPDAVERESSTRKDELKPARNAKAPDAPEVVHEAESGPALDKHLAQSIELIRSRLDYYITTHTAQCAAWKAPGSTALQSCTCSTGKAWKRIEAALLFPAAPQEKK